MSRPSMLPYPLLDWDVKEALDGAAMRAPSAEVTLAQAWAWLLAGALVEMARRQRGTVSAAFVRGARHWARTRAEAALWRIEHEDLHPLCDLDRGDDSVVEEIEALGMRLGEDGDA